MSQAVGKRWLQHCYNAVSLDIQLGGDKEDILSRDGFYNYVDYAMQLFLDSYLLKFQSC